MTIDVPSFGKICKHRDFTACQQCHKRGTYHRRALIVAVNKRLYYYLTNGICTNCGKHAYPKLTEIVKRKWGGKMKNKKIFRKYCTRCDKVCMRCTCI